MRTSLLVVLFLGTSVSIMAQIGKKNTYNLSAGIDGVYATRAFGINYNVGAGVALKAEYVWAKHVSATASAGYLMINGRNKPSINLVPLQGGMRYYFGNFYAGVEGGAMLTNAAGFNSGLLYTFSFGDEIITGRNGNSLDISARINNWNSDQRLIFYGLRIAYEFRFSN